MVQAGGTGTPVKPLRRLKTLLSLVSGGGTPNPKCTIRSDVASRRPETGAAACFASIDSRSWLAPGAVFFFCLFDPDPDVRRCTARSLGAIGLCAIAGREQAAVAVQVGCPHREVIAHAAHDGRSGGAVALVMLDDMADAGEQFAPLIVSRVHAFAPNRQ